MKRDKSNTINEKIFFRFGDVFRPSDTMSVCLARLSVLSEDLRFEVGGFADAESDLETLGARHRQVYFLRRAVATRHEVGDTLRELRKCHDLSRVTRTFNNSEEETWRQVIELFSKNTGGKGKRRLLTDIRHDMVDTLTTERRMAYGT